MKILGILTISMSFLFIGCSSNVPDCNDSEVKDLVLEIANEEVFGMLGKGFARITELSLESARTTNTNEKTGANSCAADMRIKQDSGNIKQNRTVPITYTVESANDGEEFYVTVYGL